MKSKQNRAKLCLMDIAYLANFAFKLPTNRRQNILIGTNLDNSVGCARMG